MFCWRTLIQPIFRWGDHVKPRHGMSSSRKRSSWSTQRTSPGRAVGPQISQMHLGHWDIRGICWRWWYQLVSPRMGSNPNKNVESWWTWGFELGWMSHSWTRPTLGFGWIWEMTFWDTQTRLGKMMSARYLTFPTSLWAKHGTWLLCCSILLL